MTWRIVYTVQARLDARQLAASNLRSSAEDLIDILREDPYQSSPFEALVGNLMGAYSRRINIQHRLVYQVLVEERVVKVIRLAMHYE